ncbi:MAG: hypothetical protein RDU89_07090 [bacterium]|nr:hypothetical protein [bacterium]
MTGMALLALMAAVLLLGCAGQSVEILGLDEEHEFSGTFGNVKLTGLTADTADGHIYICGRLENRSGREYTYVALQMRLETLDERVVATSEYVLVTDRLRPGDATPFEIKMRAPTRRHGQCVLLTWIKGTPTN